jgi:nucleotide-binding universal stress UspA family protein
MKTILVPLDGSALAEQVLPHVTMLARLLDARVRLLHVLTDVDREGVITSGGVPRRGIAGTVTFYSEIEPHVWATLRAQADIYLTAQAKPLRDAGLVVDIDIRKGIPHMCILEAAGSEPETVIALATHGYGGLRRWAVGSIADRVIQNTTVPVFIVRGTSVTPPDTPVLRRIMVTLDGSEMARCVLPQAAALARSAGGELIVLQAVVPRPHYAGLSLMQRNQTAQALDALARDIRQQQVMVTPAVAVDHASVAQAIVDEAARRHVDLIVMATHAYGGWQRWMHGSVADTVLHTTTTPVLLVRVDDRGGLN